MGAKFSCCRGTNDSTFCNDTIKEPLSVEEEDAGKRADGAWTLLGRAEAASELGETLLASSATNDASSLQTSVGDLLSLAQEIVVNDSNSAPSSSGRSPFFSKRIQTMMQSRSQYSDETELEIDFSKSHWSEVSGLAALSEDDEEVDRENKRDFEELMKNPDYGGFFVDHGGIYKLGRKIAEGGQAEIFEVTSDLSDRQKDLEKFLVKVFKKGLLLQQFQKTWPLGVLRKEISQMILWGMMLEDGRFAFMMLRCQCDLRKLIDQAMQSKNMQGPPFPYEFDGQTWRAAEIMWQVAMRMVSLHEKGILHRDLKASNILYISGEFFVADFECSIGVLGTTFWRAPEILLALKKKEAVIFTEKVDVYSFGMTCFEIATGCLPFEGEVPSRSNNDLIIDGWRPELPSDLDSRMKDLITKCWAPDLNRRPIFLEIQAELEKMLIRA